MNFYITQAIKLTNVRHSGEGRNPEGYWMPDQIRHDAIGDFNCRVNNLMIPAGSKSGFKKALY